MRVNVQNKKYLHRKFIPYIHLRSLEETSSKCSRDNKVVAQRVHLNEMGLKVSYFKHYIS